jgi:hypothetical protein
MIEGLRSPGPPPGVGVNPTGRCRVAYGGHGDVRELE